MILTDQVFALITEAMSRSAGSCSKTPDRHLWNFCSKGGPEMTDILRPVLELSVIIPRILLSYLPVKAICDKQPLKLTAWLLPLLLGICIFGGAVCCALHFPTRWILFSLLPVYLCFLSENVKNLCLGNPSVFFWQFFAVFACVNSLSRQSMHL